MEWCPRCGTCVNDFDGAAIVPMLVERCRKFEERFADTSILLVPYDWMADGIDECIHLSADRPK